MWLSQFPLTFCQTQNENVGDVGDVGDVLRDVAWVDIFSASAVARNFCEWVQV